jgi:hypothetical protein
MPFWKKHNESLKIFSYVLIGVGILYFIKGVSMRHGGFYRTPTFEPDFEKLPLPPPNKRIISKRTGRPVTDEEQYDMSSRLPSLDRLMYKPAQNTATNPDFTYYQGGTSNVNPRYFNTPWGMKDVRGVLPPGHPSTTRPANVKSPRAGSDPFSGIRGTIGRWFKLPKSWTDFGAGETGEVGFYQGGGGGGGQGQGGPQVGDFGGNPFSGPGSIDAVMCADQIPGMPDPMCGGSMGMGM